MRNKNNPGLYEQDDLSPQDLLDVQHPMITMPDGTKRVSCTNCHQRPLKVARLCQECYDEKIRVSEWRARLGIVRRGKGKPKLTCPWCKRTGQGYVEGGLSDACCGEMQMAILHIGNEEREYQRAADHFDIPGGL
jgi:hypothetical protein